MKLRPFELALVIFFGVMALAALILLATVSPQSNPQDDPTYVGPVQVWGTIPSAPINDILAQLKESDPQFTAVSYRYIPEEEFNTSLIEAIADGVGPDVIFVSHEELTEQRKRIRPVSYESWPLRDFQDSYLDGTQIFALSDGIYGMPMLVDPLMMYWNKDVLTNAGFLTAPRTWEELVNVQLPAMINRSFDRTINRGVIAMGTYDNIENAYASISLLLVQSGSSFVSERILNEQVKYNVSLSEGVTGGNPFSSSLSFYLRFSQPANTLYSWNRSFSSDRTQFISEDLVLYFGFGSEGRQLESLNPNLNFDVAEVPQGAGSEVRRTYGKFYAMFVMRSADNLTGSYNVMNRFTNDTVLSQLAQGTNMVPVKRSLVANGSNDIFGRVAYRSAPIAYGWLNPSKVEVDEVFSDMVSDVSENRNSVDSAISITEGKLSRLYE